MNVPDQSHVGRLYTAPGQVIDGERAQQVAAAIAGPDAAPEPGSIPPTFAAVYCLAPTFAQLFTDPEVGVNLAGLIHGEQSFEWPNPVHAGDVVDASAEITAIDEKRGLTFITLAVEGLRRGDGAQVCRGTSRIIIRGPSG
jgi:hypothetical protein